MSVLETDVAKLDDLESQVDQMTELYEKEKDLNKQLLNSAQSNDEEGADTDRDGEGHSVSPGVKVSGNAMDQIFRVKFEAEQQLTLKLQDELRDMKAQLNHQEATQETHIKAKEKVA